MARSINEIKDLIRSKKDDSSFVSLIEALLFNVDKNNVTLNLILDEYAMADTLNAIEFLLSQEEYLDAVAWYIQKVEAKTGHDIEYLIRYDTEYLNKEGEVMQKISRIKSFKIWNFLVESKRNGHNYETAVKLIDDALSYLEDKTLHKDVYGTTGRFLDICIKSARYAINGPAGISIVEGGNFIKLDKEDGLYENLGEFLDHLEHIIHICNLDISAMSINNIGEYLDYVLMVCKAAAFTTICLATKFVYIDRDREAIMNLPEYIYRTMYNVVYEESEYAKKLYKDSYDNIAKAFGDKESYILELVNRHNEDTGTNIFNGYTVQNVISVDNCMDVTLLKNMVSRYMSEGYDYNCKQLLEIMQCYVDENKKITYSKALDDLVKAIEYLYGKDATWYRFREFPRAELLEPITETFNDMYISDNYEVINKYSLMFERLAVVSVNNVKHRFGMTPSGMHKLSVADRERVEQFIKKLYFLSNYCFVDCKLMHSDNRKKFISYILLRAKSLLFVQIAFYSKLNTEAYKDVVAISKYDFYALYMSIGHSCGDELRDKWYKVSDSFRSKIDSAVNFEYGVKDEKGSIEGYTVYKFVKYIMNRVKENNADIDVNEIIELMHSNLPGNGHTYGEEIEYIKEPILEIYKKCSAAGYYNIFNVISEIKDDIVNEFNLNVSYEVKGKKIECRGSISKILNSAEIEIIRFKEFCDILAKLGVSVASIFCDNFKDNVTALILLCHRLIALLSIYLNIKNKELICSVPKAVGEYLVKYKDILKYFTDSSQKFLITEFVSKTDLVNDVNNVWYYDMITPNGYERGLSVDKFYQCLVNPGDKVTEDMINKLLKTSIQDGDNTITYSEIFESLGNFCYLFKQIVSSAGVFTEHFIKDILLNIDGYVYDKLFDRYFKFGIERCKFFNEYDGQGENIPFMTEFMKMASMLGIVPKGINDANLIYYLQYVFTYARISLFVFALILSKDCSSIKGLPLMDLKAIRVVANDEITYRECRDISYLTFMDKAYNKLSGLVDSKNNWHYSFVDYDRLLNVEEACEYLINCARTCCTKDGMNQVFNKVIPGDNRIYLEDMIYAVDALKIIKGLVKDGVIDNMLCKDIGIEAKGSAYTEYDIDKYKAKIIIDFNTSVDNTFNGKSLPDDVDPNNEKEWGYEVKFFHDQFVDVIAFVGVAFKEFDVTDDTLEGYIHYTLAVMRKIMFAICVYRGFGKIKNITHICEGDAKFYLNILRYEDFSALDEEKILLDVKDKLAAVISNINTFSFSYDDGNTKISNVNVLELYNILMNKKEVGSKDLDELRKLYDRRVDVKNLENALKYYLNRGVNETNYENIFELAANLIILYRFVDDKVKVFRNVKAGLLKYAGSIKVRQVIVDVVEKYLELCSNSSNAKLMECLMINISNDNLSDMIEEIKNKFISRLPDGFGEQMLKKRKNIK